MRLSTPTRSNTAFAAIALMSPPWKLVSYSKDATFTAGISLVSVGLKLARVIGMGLMSNYSINAWSQWACVLTSISWSKRVLTAVFTGPNGRWNSKFIVALLCSQIRSTWAWICLWTKSLQGVSHFCPCGMQIFFTTSHSLFPFPPHFSFGLVFQLPLSEKFQLFTSCLSDTFSPAVLQI